MYCSVQCDAPCSTLVLVETAYRALADYLRFLHVYKNSLAIPQDTSLLKLCCDLMRRYDQFDESGEGLTRSQFGQLTSELGSDLTMTEVWLARYLDSC